MRTIETQNVQKAAPKTSETTFVVDKAPFGAI